MFIIFLVKKIYVSPHFKNLILFRYVAVAIHTYIQRTKAENIYAEVLAVFVFMRIWVIFILFFFMSRFSHFCDKHILFLL